MVVIALAGQPGCGSSTTAKLLANRLGLAFFSVGSWNKDQLKLLQGKKTRSETQDSIEMWRSARGSSAGFHHDSDMMQKEIAAKGDVVIDGKLSIHMLRGYSSISIWLKADFSIRADRVANRDESSRTEAEMMLKEKESLERESWKKIYGFDYFEQEQEADIVIDVGNKEPGAILDIILKTMNDRNLIDDRMHSS